MKSSPSWFQIAGRGHRWRDRIAIVAVLFFRSRPGFWRLLAKLVGDRDHVVTVRTPCGPARLVFNPLHTSELTVLDELLPGDIYIACRQAGQFLDCGAFRGISTIYIQDQVRASKVSAFEPQPENFAVLSRRLATHLPGAVCVNAAVGAKNGEVLFGGGGVGGSVGEEGAPVRMIRLRDELAADGSAGLVVKMDIEGSEREVLPDVLPVLPRECSLFLETHFPLETSEAMVERFRQAGFIVRESRRRPEEDSDVLFIDWTVDRTVHPITDSCERQRHMPS
jgi:FkbM family methyltransferase